MSLECPVCFEHSKNTDVIMQVLATSVSATYLSTVLPGSKRPVRRMCVAVC